MSSVGNDIRSRQQSQLPAPCFERSTPWMANCAAAIGICSGSKAAAALALASPWFPMLQQVPTSSHLSRDNGRHCFCSIPRFSHINQPREDMPDAGNGENCRKHCVLTTVTVTVVLLVRPFRVPADLNFDTVIPYGVESVGDDSLSCVYRTI